MALNDRLRDPDSARFEFPDFDLRYGVDDHEAPTQVTIYSDSVDDIDTHWISIDAASAVDVVDVA